MSLKLSNGHGGKREGSGRKKKTMSITSSATSIPSGSDPVQPFIPNNTQLSGSDLNNPRPVASSVFFTSRGSFHASETSHGPFHASETSHGPIHASETRQLGTESSNQATNDRSCDIVSLYTSIG